MPAAFFPLIDFSTTLWCVSEDTTLDTRACYGVVRQGKHRTLLPPSAIHVLVGHVKQHAAQQRQKTYNMFSNIITACDLSAVPP